MKISVFISILLGHISYIQHTTGASLSNCDVMVYLSQYGYISSRNLINFCNSVDGSILKRAIENFQSFAGLNITGEMNDETEETMKLPRCGVKDKVGSGSDSRSKRYALQGSRWNIRNLTYKITRYPPNNLSKQNVDKELQRAFAVWSEYTDLTFTQKRSGSVNIEIKFKKGEHGDGDPFDGPGGTLAHAYFPNFSGDVHFDAAEQWTIGEHSGTNLFQVATHVIGHSLGLIHSDDKNAVMAPFYRGYQPYFELHSDDVFGIQGLYGSKSIPSTSSPKVNSDEETPKQSSNDETLCRTSTFDAIFQSASGNTYVFKGNQYWRLGEQTVKPGYPKIISNGWPGLPGNIDSAFTYRNGKTYFFKGNQYWRYHGRKMDGYYPKDISSGFSGIPSDIDAAMVWSGEIYFFKGAEFWRFDPIQRPPVKNTYPKPISNWEGIPNNLDDAFQYSNGYTYFFKDGAYYRFNDRAFAVDWAIPAFPRSTAAWWFGCQSAPKGTINHK